MTNVPVLTTKASLEPTNGSLDFGASPLEPIHPIVVHDLMRTNVYLRVHLETPLDLDVFHSL